MNLWYALVRSYVRLGLKLYFREIKVVGKKNIPSTGPVMFTVNHQNAFLDALLVATSNHRHTHFLVRADVFNIPLIPKFFATLNMMPVYRIRDGRHSLLNNHQIFERCFEVLSNQHAIMLFPEANHHQKRLLLPLSKGFTRIALGMKEPISIVPVGINYTHHRVYGASVSLYYGTPLSTNDYKNNTSQGNRTLTQRVHEEMQQLITSIPEDQYYQRYLDYLNQNRWQYLDPYKCNQWIRNTSAESIPMTKSSGHSGAWQILVRIISGLFNFLPLLVSSWALRKIGDPVFSSSIKFLSGILLFPLYYLLLGGLLWHYTSVTVTFCVLSLCVLSFIARKRTLVY